MNPQFIKNNTVLDNLSESDTEAKPQQYINHTAEATLCNETSIPSNDTALRTRSKPIAKPSCLELGDEYLSEGHITTHPFSLNSEKLSGQLNYGQIFSGNSQTSQFNTHQDCSGSTDNSRELSHYKPVSGSGWPNQSTFSDPLKDSQQNFSQITPETKPHQDYSGSTDNSRELSQYKPVGGSGWLHKYTKLKSTKNGLIEYPRVPEGKRSPDNYQHWYWDYCWQKKDKNGQPLFKKGSNPVISSTYCPQKTVRMVQNAITAKLPHRKILELIKGEYSTPPPT